MRARLLLWAERLLVGAGTLALIWCAATAGDALLAQRAARGSFEAARLAARALAPPPRAGSATRPTAGRLSAGDAIAALSMPRIGLSAIVLHGSDERTLRRGPGHLEYTPLPGQPGNVVIAGHRDSHFWPLRNVRLGDDVFVDTAGGRFRYQVSALRVVPPHEVSVLAPTTDDVLTLITCYPFWVWGNAPDRLIVRARRVEIGTAAAAVASPPLEGAGSPLSAVVSMRDEDRVRDALERFRLAYNARAGASLRFDACEISTAAEQATATCIARGAAASARTFSLARTAGGWIITSVALR